MFLSLEAYDPAGLSVTLTDDTVPTPTNGYVVLQDVDWGDVDRQVEYSGPRGTLGRVVTSETVNDRVVSIPVRVTGSSKDDLAASIAVLEQVVDAIRMFGGRVVRRASGQTYRQYLPVTGTADIRHTGWTHRRGEVLNRTVLTVTLVCAPFAEGDPMDWEDDFTTDTVTAGRYTFDAGVGSTDVAAGAGALAPAGVMGTERRFVHSYTGYRVMDRMQVLRFTASATVAGEKIGCVFRRRDANNYLAVIWTLGANTFELRKVVGGVVTTTAITVTGGPTPGAGKRYVMAVWTFADRVSVAVKEGYVFGFLAESSDLVGVAVASVTLTGTDAVNHSRAVGTGGVVWVPQATSGAVLGYRDLPFTSALQWNPGEVHFHDAIPGDADAKCDLVVSHTAAANDVRQVIAGWSQQRLPHNRIGFNQFLYAGTGATSGSWRTTGSAIVGASTSLTRESLVAQSWATHRGSIYGKVVCPATSGSGVAYQLPLDFNHGERWVGVAWLAGNVATNARIQLGSAGNNVTSTLAALPTSGAPVMHKVVLTGETTRPEFGMKIGAATATTMYVSNPMVFRGRWANLSAGINSTVTSVALTSYPQDWPTTAPFDVVVDTEYMTVTAVDPVAATLTVRRAVESTTAASHASGADVYVLPDFDQRCGEAGHPIGSLVVPADNTTTVVVNVDGDREIQETVIPPDPIPSFLVYVDGSASRGYIDVWTCAKKDAGSAAPQVKVFAASRAVGGAVYPEYGSSYISLQTNPVSGAAAWWMRLGTLQCARGPIKVQAAYLDTVSVPLNTYWCMIAPHGQVVSAYFPFSYTGDIRITSDLAVKSPNGVVLGSASGGLIEVPSGAVTLTYRVYDGDDAVSDKAATAHLSVTPRWKVLRTT